MYDNTPSIQAGTNVTNMDYTHEDDIQRQCMDSFDEPEYDVCSAITKYVFPFFLVIGTFGNLGSLCYLHHLSCNVWSTCQYLTVMSVVDLLVLYIDCGNKWYQKIFQEHLGGMIMNTSDAVCKAYPFSFQFLLHLRPWIIVATSVELLIATRFPSHIYRKCTRERGKAVLLILTVLLMCLNMHYFWTQGLTTYTDGSLHVTECVYIEEFSEIFRDEIWPYLNLSIGYIVPMLVVTVCFFCSVTSYLNQQAKKDLVKSTLEKYFMDLKSLQQLKIALIIISLFFIIVNTMKIMLIIIGYLVIKEVIIIPCSLKSRFHAINYLMEVLRDALLYLFLSTKFFIYFATCERFRKQVLMTFLNLWRKCRRKDHVTLTSWKCPGTKPLMKQGNPDSGGSSQSAAGNKSKSTSVSTDV